MKHMNHIINHIKVNLVMQINLGKVSQNMQWQQMQMVAIFMMKQSQKHFMTIM